jgi:hypothetical protein
MAQQFAKVDALLDQHPKIRRAGLLGSAVFQFVIRRNAALDGNGSIPAANVEPWYLADQLMMTEAQAEEGVAKAVRAKLLTIEGDRVVLCGWDDEWAKRPLTEAERKAQQRIRAKSPDVTNSHDANVTCPDTVTPDRDSPDSHTSEEIRGEERRGEREKPDASASDLDRFDDTLPGLPGIPIAGPRSTKPTKAETLLVRYREVALEVLAHLGAKNGVKYQGSKEHVRLLARLLDEGVAKADLVAICEYAATAKVAGGLGWLDDANMRSNLRPETLFGPETHTRYLEPARSLAERRARSPTGAVAAVAPVSMAQRDIR